MPGTWVGDRSTQVAPASGLGRDLRMPLVALAGWAGGLAGLLTPSSWLIGSLLGVGVGFAGSGVTGRRRRGHARPDLLTMAALVAVAAAVAAGAQLRMHRVAENPVADLARERAAVGLALRVTSDPRPVRGRFADSVVLRARVTEVSARGVSYRLGLPVLVVADTSWGRLQLGSSVRTHSRLSPATDHDVAALVRPLDPPVLETAPAWFWRGAEGVRAALRASVSGVPADRRPLVPALVVGDDQGLDPALAADFRTTGLTHLLAVSGTNLTLVLGFVLVTARWLGLHGRWRYALAAGGIVGFVLLARPEPSVLRAAVMGGVGLLGLGTNGRRRGGRSLGVAVVALLLVDPWLAPTPGFALSVLATAGIVFLAPVWRDALSGWLPRWLAEAATVPAAAQLACTPVVAALSGQVSLVAVGANLAAAPAVGPATVLGLGGGLAGLVWAPAGRLLGTLAGWCVAWIVAVARHGAALPLPAVGWRTSATGLALLVLLCVTVAIAAPMLLRRPRTGAACCLLLVAVVLVRLPEPGWPPDGWVLAACDVGQGDALVVRAGAGAGIVVDAGPDPALVDGCLRGLGVTRVPLLLLTHFHRDHVDGIEGVVRGREVAAVEVTPLADPPEGVAEVAAAADRLGVPVRASEFAQTRRVGEVTLQVLWPPPSQPTTGPGDGSTANNASLVLLVRVRGVTLLLTGDIEPPGQEALARSLPELTVDVLKVPHHGSRYQDLGFLTSLRARVALVSVGADNDYGHPSPDTVDALEGAGTRVLRTDLDGDLVVIERGGRLFTRTRS